MKLHEYQAKEVFERFGVDVPKGKVAETVDEAVKVGRELGCSHWVVKAQVHAGGRGKGGGVKLCSTLDELREAADRILGMRLVTAQTGEEGKLVRKVLVSEACEIGKEFYAGVVLDRKKARPVFMVSPEGGVEIEQVAAERPDRIFKETIDPRVGLHDYQGRKLARSLGLSGKTLRSASSLLVALGQVFLKTDASLAEVNPLVQTSDDRILALDAKLSIDDSALFRQKSLVAYRDLDEEDPLEVRASGFGLSYIRLDGNIGCMVNGAGLAMATLDIIQHFDGEPANFLDVGGGASTENVSEAFKIILEDERVSAILVNIFGGIMKCDVIAEGIVEAAKSASGGKSGSAQLKVPLVVRLEGTNVDRGQEILRSSGLEIVAAASLPEAAQKVVQLAAGQNSGGN